jgi:hypothetical protein
MTKCEVLSGLPPYGPAALNFSATGQGKHREGCVIRFTSEVGDSWVGNFQPGLEGINCVMQHPDGAHVIVVAGGEAYIVCPKARKCEQTFGGQITWSTQISGLGLLLFVSLTDVLAIDKTGIAWRSRRISWDGFRKLNLEGEWLTGEAYAPFDVPWVPFRRNVANGQVEGGTYPA